MCAAHEHRCVAVKWKFRYNPWRNHQISFKAPMPATMTDSIKHFTGFDISERAKQNSFYAKEAWGIDVDAANGKEN
jgi:lysyl-tRNA synthetase class 2